MSIPKMMKAAVVEKFRAPKRQAKKNLKFLKYRPAKA